MSVEQIERLRVAWVDTDAGGRIHFTAVFRYAELAETALRRRLGLLGDWGDYPRRHVEADYLAVLRFDDEVEVVLRPKRLGHTPSRGRGKSAAATRSASAGRIPSCTSTPPGARASSRPTCARRYRADARCSSR